MGIAGLYFIGVCMLPLILTTFFLELSELRRIQLFADGAPLLAMASPFTVIIFLFNEIGSQFPRDTSTAPFYVVHGVLLGFTILGIRRRGRKLREMYLPGPRRETN